MQQHFSNLQRTFQTWVKSRALLRVSHYAHAETFQEGTQCPSLWGPVFAHWGTDGSPSSREYSLPFPQSSPPKWWELKGPCWKCKARFAHLEKPMGWEDPESFPRVWRPQSQSCPAPEHPLQVWLNSHLPPSTTPWNLPGDDFSSSASWITILFSEPFYLKNHVPSRWFFNSLRVFFLPKHFPQTYCFSLIHSSQFLLCFTFSSTILKVLRSEAKWAFMSSEGELRADAHCKGVGANTPD